MCVYACVYTCICPHGINNRLLLSGAQSDPSVSPRKTNFTGDVQFFTDTHHLSSQRERKVEKRERHTHTQSERSEEDKERGKEWRGNGTEKRGKHGAKLKGKDGGNKRK